MAHRRRHGALVAAWIVLAGLSRGVAAPSDTEAPTLSAAEVQKYFAPYVAGVRACYVASALGADGTLRLELIIQPDGGVFRLAFTAGGVGGAARSKLDACLRKRAASWHFPVRSRYTTAVLPFLFQETRAPGAGPIERDRKSVV